MAGPWSVARGAARTWSRSSRSVSAHVCSSSFYPGSQRADHSYSLYSFFGWGRRQHIAPARAGQMKNEEDYGRPPWRPKTRCTFFYFRRSGNQWFSPSPKLFCTYTPRPDLRKKLWDTKKPFFIFIFSLFLFWFEACAMRARGVRETRAMVYPVRLA